MRKFIIYVLLIGINSAFIFADSCNFYGEQAKYYEQKAIKDLKYLQESKTKSKWCQLADDLEQALNYLGLVKKNCINGYKVDKTISDLSPVLLQATLNCGH